MQGVEINKHGRREYKLSTKHIIGNGKYKKRNS